MAFVMPGTCLSLHTVIIGMTVVALIGATAYYWLAGSIRMKELDSEYRLLVILSAVALIEMGVFVNYCLLLWKIC